MFIVFNNKIKVHSFFSRWLLHPTGSENGKKNELYFRKKESMEAVMKSYKILFLGQHQFLPEQRLQFSHCLSHHRKHGKGTPLSTTLRLLLT
ncbi:uncharacterized protein isoform X2 [Rhodnius prolixus]|uniref:uncharacterized protein isoform X2 n=1 Tax=Rhodnius prolixus TaxID=13249 RepID=UPI003D18ED47